MVVEIPAAFVGSHVECRDGLEALECARQMEVVA
jgi:hypothetical protein